MWIEIFESIVFYCARAWRPIFDFLRALVLALLVQVQRGRKEKAE